MDNGFFGGFGKGLAASKELTLKQDQLNADTALKSRGLDINQQTADASGEYTRGLIANAQKAHADALARQQQTDAQKLVFDTLDHAAKMAEALKQSGNPPDKINQAIDALIESARGPAQVAGLPPSFLDTKSAAIKAMPADLGKVTKTGEDLLGGTYSRVTPYGQTPMNVTGPNTQITGGTVQDIPANMSPAEAVANPSALPAGQTLGAGDGRIAQGFSAVAQPMPSELPIKTPGKPITDNYGNVGNSNNRYVRAAIELGTTDWKQLDAEATRYNMGDNTVVTAYGRATKGPMAIQRAAVIARGNDLMIAQGMKPGEVAGARAKNKALDKSLSAMTEMQSAVDSFSEAESKNLDRLQILANKVDSTGVPAAERWIRAGKQETGDPDVAAFNFQYQTVKAGVARIIQNPRLAGMLSDEARKEIERGFPSKSSASQISAIIDVAKGDFRRRSDALDAKIKDLQSQFRGLGLRSGDNRELLPADLLSSHDKKSRMGTTLDTGAAQPSQKPPPPGFIVTR